MASMWNSNSITRWTTQHIANTTQWEARPYLLMWLWLDDRERHPQIGPKNCEAHLHFTKWGRCTNKKKHSIKWLVMYFQLWRKIVVVFFVFVFLLLFFLLVWSLLCKRLLNSRLKQTEVENIDWSYILSCEPHWIS